jgi:hypothetical protein
MGPRPSYALVAAPSLFGFAENSYDAPPNVNFAIAFTQGELALRQTVFFR